MRVFAPLSGAKWWAQTHLLWNSVSDYIRSPSGGVRKYLSMQSTGSRPLKIQHRKRGTSKNIFIYEKPRTKWENKTKVKSRSQSRSRSRCRSCRSLIYKTGCYRNICVIAVSYSRSVGCWFVRREQYRKIGKRKCVGASATVEIRDILKMKAFIVAGVCLFGLLSLGSAQFQNGRLEPPNPQLCAQRIIHEKTPDGKGWVDHLIPKRIISVHSSTQWIGINLNHILYPLL